MLAAIDHNMHLCRGQQLNAAGEERGHRKYSKRTQKFHAETVKEEKAGYSYFPFLVAKMLKECCLLEGSFSQTTDDNAYNPKQIAPTIAMKAAPSTEELMKGPSRLAKPPLKKWNSSTGEADFIQRHHLERTCVHDNSTVLQFSCDEEYSLLNSLSRLHQVTPVK